MDLIDIPERSGLDPRTLWRLVRQVREFRPDILHAHDYKTNVLAVLLARWFGILAASINAIGQLYYVPAYPFWSLSMFAVDILIIYGLAAYGGRQLRNA